MAIDIGSYIGYASGYELDPYNTLYVMIKSNIDKMWTALPVKVTRVYDNYFVDVIPVIKYVDANNNAIDATTQYHVPYARMQGGVNGIVINPQVDDFGWCIYAQRDISSLKNIRESKQDTESLSDPVQIGSFRSYDLSDGMYLGGMFNAMPSRYIRISNNDIYIEGDGKPVTVHTSNKINIEASSDITIKSSTKIVLDAPQVDVTGVLQQTGTRSSGSASSFADNVVVDGISVSGHVHTGVETGSGQSGPPAR